MGNVKTKLAALPLIAVLMLAAVSPCYASEAPTGDEAPATVAAAAPADQVPIARMQNEINGEMVIEEVFEISATMDPNELVREGFEVSGYYYTEDSIVKTPFTESREMGVEQLFTAATNTENMVENLKLLPLTVEYNEDGYVGTLHLDPATVNLVETAYKTQSSTNKKVMTYELEMNDPTLVPSTYAGLPRTSLTWTANGYIEDSSIPSSYTATATYSKTSSWQKASAWEVRATYVGTATYENTNNIRYTVTYKGKEMPKGSTVVNGVLVPKGYSLGEDQQLVKTSHMGAVLPVLITLGITLLLASVVLALLWALKKGLIVSRKIRIQAQDDATGEYSLIQKVRINKKAPSLTIDTLRAPSSRHFLCSMAGRQAMVLRGKIINIFADGQVVSKHKVEPLSETDEYIFSVDLEVVDAGPMDTFSL